MHSFARDRKSETASWHQQLHSWEISGDPTNPQKIICQADELELEFELIFILLNQTLKVKVLTRNSKATHTSHYGWFLEQPGFLAVPISCGHYTQTIPHPKRASQLSLPNQMTNRNSWRKNNQPQIYSYRYNYTSLFLTQKTDQLQCWHQDTDWPIKVMMMQALAFAGLCWTPCFAYIPQNPCVKKEAWFVRGFGPGLHEVKRYQKRKRKTKREKKG